MGLDLKSLGSFEDHDGFDGTMLGRKGSSYHLEFTHQRGVDVGPAPTRENLLVFYIPERSEWEAACTRAEKAGFSRAEAHNPYWEQNGQTYEDPEGYRIVIENSGWDPA